MEARVMKKRDVERKPFSCIMREELHVQLKVYCKSKGVVLYRVVEDIIEEFLSDKNVEVKETGE